MKRLLVLLAFFCWAPPLVLTPLCLGQTPNYWNDSDTDGDFHNDNNWSLSHEPTNTEVATLDATSTNNCTIDEDIDVLGILVDNAYSGTLDMDGGGGDPPTIAVGTSGIDLGTGVSVNMDRAAITITGGPFDYLNAGTGWTTGTGSVTLAGTCVVTGDHAQELYKLDTGSGTVTIHSDTDSRVVVTNTCTIGGPVVLDDILCVTADGDMVLNEGATFSGSSYLYLQNSTNGHGLTTLHSSVTVPDVDIHRAVAGTRLAAGTYGGLVRLFATTGQAFDSLLELDSFATYGAYNFDGGLELENGGTGLVTLDNSTNDPTINVTDLTIDLDAGGDILIDDTATAVDWSVSGNWVDEDDGGGAFSWAQGTGSRSLTGTANQTIDTNSVDIGNWGIYKSTSGKVTIDDSVLGLAYIGSPMVGDGSEALVVTNSTITSSSSAKSFAGATANSADVNFSSAGNDVDLGSATWTVTNGDFNYVNCGTWSAGSSTITLVGTGTVTGNHLLDLNNFYLEAGVGGAITLESDATRIDVLNDCRISGAVVLNTPLSVVANGDFFLLEGASFTGAEYLQLLTPSDDHGLVSLHSSVTTPPIYILTAQPGSELVAGTYAGLVKLISYNVGNSVLQLLGTYNFNGGLELETTSSGACTLANNVHGPTISVTDLTFDKDSTGTITVSNAGQATALVITGDVLNEGAATWTKGTGSITANSIGKLGGCFEFNGSSDEVDINAQLHDFSTDFTIAAWIRLPTVTSATTRDIFSQGANSRLYANASGGLTYLTGGDATFTGNSVFTANTWHYVMVTYDDTATDVVKIYVDNVEEATEDKTAANTAADSRIGSYIGVSQWFPGHIDDVRIWNKALSAAERAALYNSGNGTTDDVAAANCLALYTFDDFAANTTVADSSGNSNTGTATQNTIAMSAAPADWDWGSVTGTLEPIVVDTTAGTLTLSGGWTALSFELRDGELSVGGQTIETTGDFIISGGCTTVGSGFNSSAITVGGNLMLIGDPAALLDLAAGASWTLTLAAGGEVRFADVAYCDADNNPAIGHNCTDSGNNTNWIFKRRGPLKPP